MIGYSSAKKARVAYISDYLDSDSHPWSHFVAHKMFDAARMETSTPTKGWQCMMYPLGPLIFAIPIGVCDRPREEASN